MGRRVCPQPSPTTWPLSSNSSAGSFQNLCFPRSSTQLCSKPRRYPTLKTRLQPSSCCPVCCLPETLPVCIICSTSCPEFLRGSVLIAGRENSAVTNFYYQKWWLLFHRCSENLMTISNLATVFAPCLLPPPSKAEMSESRLELRVLVLHAFIENPHLFGNDIIPHLILLLSCIRPTRRVCICQASSLKMSWTAWNFWWISSFPTMRKRATEEDTL